ncbi:Cation channel family protein [Anopheles sinensis]|uniref:Cation channel family protein n=1 Tax=Anopheles sinensis TaxID=74873 RepID=A0A084W190_ANOSI|nr:Cation channel family protein [Anopheles sinensis]
MIERGMMPPAIVALRQPSSQPKAECSIGANVQLTASELADRSAAGGGTFDSQKKSTSSPPNWPSQQQQQQQQRGFGPTNRTQTHVTVDGNGNSASTYSGAGASGFTPEKAIVMRRRSPLIGRPSAETLTALSVVISAVSGVRGSDRIFIRTN